MAFFDMPPEVGTWSVSGIAALLLAFLGRRWVIQLLSRDKTQALADNSERAQITRLNEEISRVTRERNEERERADRAFDERNKEITRAALVLGEVDGYKRRVKEMTDELIAMREQLVAFYTGKEANPNDG